MSDKKRIVIVGGVAGGASAAARARRLSEDAEIIMFERGEHISFANCGLPYYIGGVIKSRERLLVQTPDSFHARFCVDVRTNTEVLGINREGKTVNAKDLKTGVEKEVPYDELILSPGAEPVRPPLPGIDLSRVMTLRNIADMDAIKQLIDEEQPKHAVVIGGGYIGLEMAEALRDREVKVTMVELMNQVMGPIDPEMATPLHHELTLNGVDLRLSTSVKAFEQESDGLRVKLSTGETLACELAILAIGVRPETTLARDAGLEVGERGGILVDAHMRTSDPAIFAVGDAIEVKDFVGGFQTVIPLAGPANRQGRIAADNIFGRPSTYKKTQGTGICKVFDLAVGMTGMNEKMLTRMEIPYEKVYIHPTSHAGYYPGAHPLSLKVLFDPESGKLLGAQAVGADGIDKRIDVLAVAIRAGMTVYDLEELELSYAPPFGSAKDPVNYAGFVAANILRGDTGICHVDEIAAAQDNQFILDVRTQEETRAGVIPGAVNIPIDELRERLSELPADREILIYCAQGLRGYLSTRILQQQGYTSRNLSGGYKTWKAVTQTVPEFTNTKKEVHHDMNVDEKEEKTAAGNVSIEKDIDACGLQCPGPIMQVNNSMKELEPGQAVRISVTDPGFAADIPAWCQSTGNRLVSLGKEKGTLTAVIQKAESAQPARSSGPASKKKSIVVFSNDFDKVMAAFIIANGAAAMGSEVTLFFTFWGLNVLRKDNAVKVKKSLVERMFGAMMPRGAKKLNLSKMHMMGMGTSMMKGIMKKKNAEPLEALIGSARLAGVRFVACTMSMDMMGIKKEEMIDGVEEGGVAMYLNEAEAGNVNLFI
jgi:NADPH-dependent 2,4-dienoyl-CoA reductase/sulfur reductase-like enzyme/peroxiredoxin family protein/rhodanese-related sulfurtransferase/TusA-related sulfurtransferase